ncbi:MAG: hypothetical protein LBV51_02930 [Acholeplasmatales bacterium]|jgi:hypothetical protein|nr:hypothetical protein [Acholeplasmatales bacterium]
MSKKFLGSLIFGIALVAVFVLWILQIANPDAFGWYSMNIGIAIITGVAAVLLLARAFAKNDVVTKKWYVILGVLFACVTVFEIVTGVLKITDWQRFLYPSIGLGIAVIVLLCVLVTGGKKWDQGDNKKVGYKNYYQRKEEEEKKNNKESGK